MNRAILIGAFAMLVGCGDDKHPGYVAPDSNGGARATGGKYNKAGSAGMAGRAGSSGVNTRGGSLGTAGDDSTEDVGGSAGTAGYAGTAGTAGDAGTAGYAGTAGTGHLAAAPVVTITTPLAAQDPSSPNVLIGDVVDVTCLATAANVPGATVDPSTVEIVLVDGANTIAPTGTPTRDPLKGTTANFSLVMRPSGSISFRCNAGDGTLANLRGSAVLTTILDRGPTIKFSAPTNRAALALSTRVTVTFDVEPSRLSATDPGADIDPATVALTIDGKPITAAPLTTTTDKITYQTVPISMKDFPFSQGNFPSGYTIVEAKAKNLRKAQGQADVTINVDDLPPDITIISPATGTIVAGEIWLSFDVIDPVIGMDPGSGVAESSVVVTVNEQRSQYSATDKTHWNHTGNRYNFMFTEADLAGSKAQATVQISAADVAGNVNSGLKSLVLYLDNQPPLVDLDPPTVREFFTEVNKTVCSSAFDPLGEAVNDRQIATGSRTFRAFVWDKTNDPGEGLTQYLSGTDQQSVTLWMQDDTRVPLLRDSDGDGICDSISTGTDQSPVRSVSLSAITPVGESPKYHVSDVTTPLVDDTRFWPYAPSITGHCAMTTTLQTSSLWLCNGNSDMVRVVRHNVSTLTPVVYGLDPVSTTSECTGRYWAIGTFADTDPGITEGWVCLAASAKDERANLGISRVLRVCYDDPATFGRPLCASDEYLLAPATTPQALPWVTDLTTGIVRSSQYAAQPNCPCEAGQNLCAYQDGTTSFNYCSAKKAHCNSDVDASKVTLQCLATEKLCVPRDPNGTPHCVPVAQACAPDVDVATALPGQCAAGQKLCIPWNAEKAAYCVSSTQSCTSDLRIEAAQCPSCVPTKYDVTNAKCTGEICQIGDPDPGCKPKNTIRCPCGPLCSPDKCSPVKYDVANATCTNEICQTGDLDPGCKPINTAHCTCKPQLDVNGATTPPGCTPYHPSTKVDPCAVTCRPPTNAGSIGYIRRD